MEKKTLQRAFVTGAFGFVGACLMEHLQSLGWEVLGYDARTPAASEFLVHQGDLRDGNELRRVLKDFQPDVVFHLAGILKSEEPRTFFEVNVMGTLSLFEAILASGRRPRILNASSSAVYGSGTSANPITEESLPQPATQYAVSKLAQEYVALQYFRSVGLHVLCGRTFNLVGPRLSSEMAPSAFARQIAEAEKLGAPAKILTGDLSAQRDYVDVRDAVWAYTLLIEHGSPGQVYNVCSGRAVSMSEVLQILLDQAKIPLEAVLDPARVQRNDIPIQVGEVRKILQSTGWKAEIPLRQSLMDLLDHWRNSVSLENV